MELKSNFGATKGLDSERSLIDKVQTEMKNVFFRVIYLMLKDEEQSVLVNAVAVIIQFMQLTYIPFNRKIYPVWQNLIITNKLNTIFGYFMITPYFNNSQFNAFVAIMYVILGSMIFGLMLVFLLSYSFSKTKSSFTWPVFILRQIVFLFTTILYLPTIDLLLSMVSCTNINGTLMLQLFTVQCWSNVHIVHGIVAILAIFLCFSLSVLFELLYNEARYVPTDSQSRQSGRALGILMTYELVMVICYSFMDGSSYDYLHIMIMMLGSFIVFWKIHVEQPFNNIVMSKIWSMLAALNMWVVTLLCFSKFLEGILFFGTVYACLAGLPLMALAVLRSEKQHYDLLLLNLNKVQDPDQVLALTNHLLKLFSKSGQNQNASLLLDGFLEIHRATCNRDDCYLKQKKNQNQRFQRPIFKENISERDIDFLMVMGQIYFNSIKKFPNEIALRVKYAFYLLDFMKQKQQALNELIQAEQLCPSLDYEFVIYRYKIIIEDQINQQQNENFGNLDVVSELAFQNNMRQFQNKIERATLMHMDFWSQLQEDSPDLGKLNDIGAKINIAIQQVEELWNKMQKMSSNLPKAMRLYGKFTIEVLQDKEYGDELQDRARHLQQQNNKMKNKAAISIVSAEDIAFEPQPSILASTSIDKFAQITNVNLACCNLFGYNKSELLNRKINILMPNIFAKFHDSFIEKSLNSTDNKSLSRERLIYIKQKSNYILPSFINLKVIQSLDENVQIAAQFRLQKSFKPSCHIIIDHEDVIDSISASCIALLSLDSKQVFHKKTLITEIFPQLPKHRELYLTKQGGPLTFYAGQQISNSQLQSQENMEEKEDQLVFTCYMTEIFNENQDQNAGYLIRLDIQSSSGDHSVSNAELQIPQNKALTHSFQFKYNPNKQVYNGEFQMDSTNSARIDQTIIWEGGDQSSMVSDPAMNTILKSQIKTEKSDDPKDPITQHINYAEGIKTLRLYENRVQEIDDREDNFSEEEEVQGRSIFNANQDQDQDAEFSLNDFNNVFKSRKNLSAVVNNNQTPSILSSLNWTTNIMILGLVAISFTDYFVTLSEYQEIYDTIGLVKDCNTRNAELSTILSSIQNLQMLQMGVWNKTTNASRSQYETLWRQKLNTSISNADTLNKGLMLSNIFISDELDQLQTNNVVSMQFSNSSYTNYNLLEAIQQVISKSLNVLVKPLTSIVATDQDVQFVQFNLLNALVYQLRNASNIYANGLATKTTNKQNLFSIIIGVSAGLLGLCLLILVIIMLQVSKSQEEILSMFLDIPDKTVKYLYNKSENFISNLQVGEEEEVLSEMDEIEKEEQDELNRALKGKKKKKKFKNTNKSQRNYIFAFILVVAILEAYFIFIYFTSTTLLNNIQQQVLEINATARAESFYRFADNGERSLYINRNQTILNSDAYSTVKANIDQLYALDSSMHQEHSINVDITNSIYSTAFTQMFMLQPCTVLANVQQEMSYVECEGMADGAIYQGMAVGLARFFEDVRYIMTIYDQFWGVPNASFTTIARGFATFKNITNNTDNVTNNILNLNNFNQSLEARNISDTYIRGTFRYLMTQMLAGFNDTFNTAKTQRLALFIVFEVVLFIIYFMLWLPIMMRLTRDMWRTRAMIIMIPLKVIQKIKSIKLYIRDFIHAKDVQV